MMMRKINYNLIGNKTRIDILITTSTTTIYISPKVNFYNNTITELKLKLELNNLYFGKWVFL